MKPQHALAALPFLAVLVGMFFVNDASRQVLGLPLPFAWMILCVVGTTIVMSVVYRLDAGERLARGREEER